MSCLIFKGFSLKNKSLQILTIFLLIVLTCPFEGYAAAATYYVSTLGNDRNTGSESSPFRTIQKAADIVQAGDTVYVRQGSYAGFAITNKNGTSGAWITFKAYPGEAVKIDPYINNYETGYGRSVDILGGSYIEISGFEMTDSNPAYDYNSFSAYSQGVNREAVKIDTYKGTAASHIRIAGNHICRLGFHGLYSSYTSSHCEIVGNLIENAGLSRRGYGMYIGGSYHTIRRNIIRNSYGHGIHVYSEGGPTPDYNTIENNFSYNNGRTDYGAGYARGSTPAGRIGDGIIVSGRGKGNVIRNNVVFGNINWGIRIGSHGASVYDNIAYENGQQGFYVCDNCHAVVRNNISYLSKSQDGYTGEAYIGPGNEQGDNLFQSRR